jgi:hypothetical protein
MAILLSVGPAQPAYQRNKDEPRAEWDEQSGLIVVKGHPATTDRVACLPREAEALAYDILSLLVKHVTR